MHPDFPIVEDLQHITDDWAVTLPEPFNRRVEDGNLIFWRPGLTIYVVVWGNDSRQSPRERLARIWADRSPDAFDILEESSDGMLRDSYRLTEDRGTEPDVHALYGFVIGQDGHVQMAAYCDNEAELSIAKAIWRSFEELTDHAGRRDLPRRGSTH